MPTKAKTVRTMLRKARARFATDPKESLRLVESLLARVQGEKELEPEAVGMLGLARQFIGDREGAFTAFRRATALEKRPLERGHLYCQWGLLEVDRHQFSAALAKASHGFDLIVASGCADKDLALGLIARGICFWRNERRSEAELDFLTALRNHIHPRKQARLYCDALQSLSICYIFGTGGLERVERALEALNQAENALRRCRLPTKSMQGGILLWTRGIVLRVIGAEERSEALYRAAQCIFRDIGAMTEWHRVSLDLGEMYLDHGQWGRLRTLVGRMLTVGGDASLTAVLSLFQQSLVAGNLTEDVIRKLYRAVHGQRRRKVPILPCQINELDAPIGF